ncbi:MAG: hypothetical protein U0640_06245 [Phycisphaerales bacterium]
MNRALWILVVWMALGLELGLREALRLRDLPIAPSFVFCCLTLVAMFASRTTVRWSALAIGLLMDLLNPLQMQGSLADVRVMGPHMLSYLVGAEVIVLVRSSTIRRNPLTLGFLAGLGAMAGAVVFVVVMTIRGWFLDNLEWTIWFQLWTRLLSGIYTGLLGIVLAFGLLPLAPYLGMQTNVPGVARSTRWQ